MGKQLETPIEMEIRVHRDRGLRSLQSALEALQLVIKRGNDQGGALPNVALSLAMGAQDWASADVLERLKRDGGDPTVRGECIEAIRAEATRWGPGEKAPVRVTLNAIATELERGGGPRGEGDG